MRGYKGYVSPSRDGILSDTPDAYEHDTVPQPYGASLSAKKLAEPDMAYHENAENPAPGMSGTAPCPDLGLADTAGNRTEESSSARETGFFSSLRCLCRGRILAAALAINCLLVLFFALIMYLDRPVPPKYVFYIDLVDGTDAGAAAKASEEAAAQESVESERGEGAAEKSTPR